MYTSIPISIQVVWLVHVYLPKVVSFVVPAVH